MKKSNIILLLLLTLLTVFIGCTNNNSKKNKKELTISAAASLKESMAEIETLFEEKHPDIDLTFNFGSSGSLQKQIEQGAPVDVFISAGIPQMDSLVKNDLILKDTNKNLLNNELVLITKDSNTISSINELSSSKITHIALGEPSSVPAGMYAKESLNKLNLYDSLNSKFVFAKDVKEVLSWVSSGNAEAGFVYKSDTINTDSVKIIETIPNDLHDPIVYPVGIIKSTSDEDSAKEFYDYLFTDECTKIFEKNGYSMNNQ